ncbi:hypothetical protein F10086_175 [Staphylococcus phage vB_SauM_JDF86]|nr:hypothetical protein F10086_175 [Staphylococcus phage vB_SauM_JDF86]
MDKAIEKASNALGQGFSTMVWQQVLIGLGFVLLSVALAFVIWVLVKKFQVPFNNPTAFVVYVIMIVAIVASFIWGVLHILNPEYYAILELKGFIK